MTVTGVVIVAAFVLALFSVSEYVTARGIDYLQNGNQVKRHRAIMEGHAGNPWQYRVLAPYLISAKVSLLKRLQADHHIATSFIVLRVVQDTLILLLAFAYYRELKLSASAAVIGMILLAWGMSYSHHNSDLQFSTFFDIIFYLLAGLSILRSKPLWIVPVTALAALNRETSALIPFMFLLVVAFARPKGSLRKALGVFIASALLYVAIFVGLRYAYGPQELIVPCGHRIGLDLLRHNLFRAVTWRQLVSTLSVIPLVAIFGYRKWPLELRVFLWTIVPIWFVVHALGAVMAESRLLLVPQALVFIPGALWCLARRAETPAGVDADLSAHA